MEILAEQKVLDVTLLEPRQKHPTIFSRLDALLPGEDLIILNDHDPKPLYYQLLSERGHAFAWEYLQEGPEQWQVKITRRVPGEDGPTLGQIAAKDLRKAEVFKKYGMDFCCGGKKTVREACAEKGLDPVAIEKELELASAPVQSRPLPYEEWNIDFLADYIVNTHHVYVRKSLPDLLQYAAKVRSVHGHNHPELTVIDDLVMEINDELLGHMVKEERVLFPYIKELVSLKHSGRKLETAPFGSVRNPISMMEMEHEMVGEHLKKIREISKQYALPQDACASYRLLYSMLQEF
ncbi:MAG TPA: DUF542 domain-containing protein, partial [Saprospiraceae bacterium]|nr:DUF542 domain-containing protein [Saprospiraceae bacterium]